MSLTQYQANGAPQRAGGPFRMTPLGYAQVAAGAATAKVLGTAVAIPAGAAFVYLMAEGGAGFRYRDDGVSPTAAIGMPIAAGTELEIALDDLTAFRWIAMDTNTIINLAFYA